MVNVGIHYMHEKYWNELNELNHERNSNKALIPRKRLVKIGRSDSEIPELPDWAHDGYVFSFPDKNGCEAWKGYEHGKEEFDTLTSEIGSKIVVVKFNILPTDEAYVVERAHFADWQWGHNKDKQDAIRKYALSRVPADKYNGQYRMPELIIKNPIALERLVVQDRIKLW